MYFSNNIWLSSLESTSHLADCQLCSDAYGISSPASTRPLWLRPPTVEHRLIRAAKQIANHALVLRHALPRAGAHVHGIQEYDPQQEQAQARVDGVVRRPAERPLGDEGAGARDRRGPVHVRDFPRARECRHAGVARLVLVVVEYLDHRRRQVVERRSKAVVIHQRQL